MATSPTNGTISPRGKGRSRSAPLAEAGIRTSDDFNAVMGAMIGDLLSGRIDADTGMAVCKAGKNMIDMATLALRHGRHDAEPTCAPMRLAP